LEWIKRHFGEDEGSVFYKRLIISHHKNLNKGDYLVDDRKKNGAGDFEGELILFGSERFPDWGAVTEYLLGPDCPGRG
jgi:5'(3')-deoxyribonucleotidase